MSSHYAERSADRQARLNEAKAAVDAENQKKYDEQKKIHDEQLNAKRAAVEQILKEEMDKYEASKASHAAKLTEMRSEMQNHINETLKAHGAEGTEKVQRAKAELDNLQRTLEEKGKLYKEQLNDDAKILENSEKLRQEEHKKIKAEGVQKKKEMNEKLLELHDKIHSTKIQGQEELRKLDEESHKKQLNQVEKESDRGFGAVLNTYELHNSVAVEDSFRAFMQKCQALIQRHATFCTEFNDIEAMLLTYHNRMISNKEIEDCDMDYLFEALNGLHAAVVQFSAAGSTREVEFTEMIRELTVMIEDLSTQFNAIQSKTDNYEVIEEKPKGERNDTGILEGILAAKEIMRKMSEKVQNFNVIPRDHLRETLAIQMKATGSQRAFQQAQAIKEHEEAHEESLEIEK